MAAKSRTKQQRKLPGGWALAVESFNKLKANWRILVGIAAAGQVVDILFGQENAAGWLWSIVVLSALIWAIRHLGDKDLGLRNAYYKGTAPFLRLALVALWLTMLLLPALVGQFIYDIVLVPGFESGLFESTVVNLIWFVLLLLSIYLLLRSIFAPFMVTLPDVKPVAAIRNSFQLTRPHLRTVLWRLWPLLLFVVGFVTVLYVLGGLLRFDAKLLLDIVRVLANLILVPFALVYLFEIYKGLSDGSQS